MKNEVKCPDCKEDMTKAKIECDDNSGFYSAWLCGCEVNND